MNYKLTKQNIALSSSIPIVSSRIVLVKWILSGTEQMEAVRAVRQKEKRAHYLQEPTVEANTGSNDFVYNQSQLFCPSVCVTTL